MEVIIPVQRHNLPSHSSKQVAELALNAVEHCVGMGSAFVRLSRVFHWDSDADALEYNCNSGCMEGLTYQVKRAMFCAPQTVNIFNIKELLR